MGHSAVALFILTPTPINFATQHHQFLIEPEAFGVFRGQSITLLLIASHLLLQLVNLPSGAGLSAIKTVRVEEKWPGHLFMVVIDGSCRGQRMHTPLYTYQPLDALPVRQFLF